MHLFPDFSILMAFLGACWVLQTSPGPDMMLIINNGIIRGTTAGLLTVFGIFLGVVVQGPILMLGTISLIAAYAGTIDILRGAGATYLGYLAYKNFRAFFVDNRGNMESTPHLRSNPVLEGFVTNLSNPKVLLFLFAFIPQFAAPEKGYFGLQLLILLAILKVNGLLVNGSVALIAGRLGKKALSLNTGINWSALLSSIVFLIISAVFWFQIISNWLDNHAEMGGPT